MSAVAQAAVDAAITTRRSVRAFPDTPVPLQTVRDILRVASRAPSGTNTQPWRVAVLTGRARAELARHIMVAARARGLDTCPQAAWATFHRLIEEFLQLPAGEMVVCGMSMGVADPQAIENTLVTEREAVEQFARFLD